MEIILNIPETKERKGKRPRRSPLLLASSWCDETKVSGSHQWLGSRAYIVKGRREKDKSKMWASGEVKESSSPLFDPLLLLLLPSQREKRRDPPTGWMMIRWGIGVTPGEPKQTVVHVLARTLVEACLAQESVYRVRVGRWPFFNTPLTTKLTHQNHIREKSMGSSPLLDKKKKHSKFTSKELTFPFSLCLQNIEERPLLSISLYIYIENCKRANSSYITIRIYYSCPTITWSKIDYLL